MKINKDYKLTTYSHGYQLEKRTGKNKWKAIKWYSDDLEKACVHVFYEVALSRLAYFKLLIILWVLRRTKRQIIRAVGRRNDV